MAEPTLHPTTKRASARPAASEQPAIPYTKTTEATRAVPTSVGELKSPTSSNADAAHLKISAGAISQTQSTLSTRRQPSASHPTVAAKTHGGSAGRPDLRIIGRTLDDLEHMRIIATNRVLAAEKTMGMPLPHVLFTLEPVLDAEKRARKELLAAFRSHPLSAWCATVPGLGRQPGTRISVARLLACIGDPADRANPSQLRAYCGHGDPNRKPVKGMTQTELFKAGNPDAKMRVHLIAESLIKQRCKACKDASREIREAAKEAGDAVPPWQPSAEFCTCLSEGKTGRVRYDARRNVTVGKLHERSCVRCGPTGHPALPGTPWSKAHCHADALRIVGKGFLLDLWIAARSLHLALENHASAEGAGA